VIPGETLLAYRPVHCGRGLGGSGARLLPTSRHPAGNPNLAINPVRRRCRNATQRNYPSSKTRRTTVFAKRAISSALTSSPGSISAASRGYRISTANGPSHFYSPERWRPRGSRCSQAPVTARSRESWETRFGRTSAEPSGTFRRSAGNGSRQFRGGGCWPPHWSQFLGSFEIGFRFLDPLTQQGVEIRIKRLHR
jgi:hypothetical protein